SEEKVRETRSRWSDRHTSKPNPRWCDRLSTIHSGPTLVNSTDAMAPPDAPPAKGARRPRDDARPLARRFRPPRAARRGAASTASVKRTDRTHATPSTRPAPTRSFAPSADATPPALDHRGRGARRARDRGLPPSGGRARER